MKIKKNLLMSTFLISILSGCSSFSSYSYAVEGQPIITPPTHFPSTDEESSEYTNSVVVSDTKFYNSYWFETNKYNIDTSSSDFRLVSTYNIKQLNENLDSKIQINGYASDLGDKNENYKLSLNRANFIKNYYISQGVNKDQIIVKAYGSSVLIYPETNNQNNPSNRRVDVLYIKNFPKEYTIEKNKPIIDVLKTNIEFDSQND